MEKNQTTLQQPYNISSNGPVSTEPFFFPEEGSKYTLRTYNQESGKYLIPEKKFPSHNREGGWENILSIISSNLQTIIKKKKPNISRKSQ